MRRYLFLVLSVFVLLCCQAPAGITPSPDKASVTITPAAPVADFSAGPLKGNVPLSVSFKNISRGEVSGLIWNFGDGTMSDELDTVHQYHTAGKFTVSLTVIGPGGKDIKTVTDCIEAVAGFISWEEALKCVGQTKTVDGVVVDATYASSINGQPTFLNIGKPYPQTGRFTALIWGSDRRKFAEEFAAAPETYFLKKHVRVSGRIQEYSGCAEIILSEPSQIKVVD